MRGNNKRGLRQLADVYWSEYWDNYPYFTHQRGCAYGVFRRNHNKPYGQLKNPKLRKASFYPKEYNFYSGCPKEWNKIFHIRPIRAANHHWAHMACTLDEDLIYLAEEKYYPNYKMHIYYY